MTKGHAHTIKEGEAQAKQGDRLGDESEALSPRQPRSLLGHLADFMADDAHAFARRLNTLTGGAPDEDSFKIGTSEPETFIHDPIHRMPGHDL